ncbi:lipid A biosynthesis lauroyl acyltransferase [Roseococcus pinisoli]|uniref:Lipid A biosynthesis lauroyl acyltransferase n=1 Tax=Roseococcus pinisoli TaxID=2835040 RepID=A0ABS5QA41_9PROT|nr:lipid A biosynthesis lauroyl acyltransferase [uncultured Roseococcus sp.]MBS7810571.1 lipid A biosynthesis lauroyl acyltransferase [Roseococcus pinisoli]
MKRLQKLGEWAVAVLARGAFGLLRVLGPDRASNLGAWITPKLGVLTRNHRHTMENLRLAFPEKTEAERQAIAREAWANLGRTVCEYPHLEALLDIEGGRVEADEATWARFEALKVSGKPALVFAAHLGNWELPAVAAFKLGQPAAILYRTPNNPYIAADIIAMREPIMGKLIAAGMTAPIRMAEALDQGLTLGMLVDQRFGRGPRVPFFGHPVAANPFLARLAKRFDAPVHGLRAIRLPGNRFRLEFTEALELPRDARGQVDVEAGTALVNGIIEGWVREHPGQWLWMHRRWRV